MEFTGERVVPGSVEPDLWNEHIARYYFAAHFAGDKPALDVGCGTGYGTALLAEFPGSALGFDISPEAIEYARAHYAAATFVVGSADAFPANSESVGLVTAFEVIEHVAEWPAIISEAARVLTPDGVFLVSTPNKLYYTEARQEAGPNPFHVHEFEYAEFELALKQCFPCVQIFAQNQQQTIAFVGAQAGPGSSFTAAAPKIAECHFFVAVCSKVPLVARPFAYIESSGNLLREREHHIHSLSGELTESRLQFSDLLEEHRRLEAELKEQNAWALSLNRDLEEARQKLLGEQQNTVSLAASYQSKLDELHGELAQRAAWAQSLNAELDVLRSQLDLLRGQLDAANDARTALEAKLGAVRVSRWHRLGHAIGLGPKLEDSSA